MRAASFLAAVTLAVIGAGASGACTTKEPQTTTYFDQTIDPDPADVVRAHEHRRRVPRRRRGGQRLRQPRSDAATPASTARRDLLLDYGPYLQPSMLVKNVAALPGRAAALGRRRRSPSRRTSSTSAGPSSTRPRAATTRCGAGSRTGRPRTTRATRPSTSRASRAPTPSRAGRRRFDPNNDPTSVRLADLPAERGAAALVDRAPPATATARRSTPSTSPAATTPQEVRWNYFAASAYLVGDAPAVARSSAARSRRRRAAATTRAARSSRRCRTRTTRRSSQWAQAHGAAGRHGARPGVPLLRAEGAAHAREEGLHDGAVPLGGDVPRLPPARRLGRELLAQHVAAELRVHRRADVVRERRREREPPRAEEPLSARGLQPGRTASRIAAVRSSRTSASTLPTGAVCDAANYDYDNAPVDTIPAYCVIYEWHKRERAERNLAALSRRSST